MLRTREMLRAREMLRTREMLPGCTMFISRRFHFINRLDLTSLVRTSHGRSILSMYRTNILPCPHSNVSVILGGSVTSNRYFVFNLINNMFQCSSLKYSFLTRNVRIPFLLIKDVKKKVSCENRVNDSK